jgi:hypothetical protein
VLFLSLVPEETKLPRVSKDFSFQTKFAHSDSPSADEAGESLLESNSATNVQSETFDVREVMARFAFQHLGRTSETTREAGSLFGRATPKVKETQPDVRVLFARENLDAF